MAGRGQQTFTKRQKEQQRKDRQQVKMEKRLQRRQENEARERSGPEMGEPIVPTEESSRSASKLAFHQRKSILAFSEITRCL